MAMRLRAVTERSESGVKRRGEGMGSGCCLAARRVAYRLVSSCATARMAAMQPDEGAARNPAADAPLGFRAPGAEEEAQSGLPRCSARKASYSASLRGP